ncbi:hypothetical protein O7632_19725 [Solwaraspora sp. WMMD406]|uniref:hypothetical protein n=1 Tax=Solwaraspora sp. WMMD406 TaxID=3016095 RepID=UPI002417BB25|nr:hypothetical protein [Solwaraspora sp. WMMD406]MDG4766316.1 hypothetical protein [Solwaraspora sp. WMMD406]
MHQRIGGLPYWELGFDAAGDPDPVAATRLVAGLRACGVTDLVVFVHGWNNDRSIATGLYEAFFGLLARQARQAGPWADTLGLVGVHWPARRWSDEPVADYAPVDPVRLGADVPAAPSASRPGGGPAAGRGVGSPGGAAAVGGVRPAGAAGLRPRAGLGPRGGLGPGGEVGPGGGSGARAAQPVTTLLDAATLHGLRATFPRGAPALDRMAHLLATAPTTARVRAFATELRQFATTVAEGFDDGETDGVTDGETDGEADRAAQPGDRGTGTPALPRMLEGDPVEVYRRFLDGLRRCDAPLAGVDAVGGAAGLGDPLRGIWNGAKEALRQLTYWQMKNRAGVVGRNGLGPLLGRLPAAVPGIRLHLVGHSFGARLVCHAAAWLPGAAPAPAPGPVRSVTLLQAAFSQFAFAPVLPFAAHRAGALVELPARVDGPLTVCYSVHDAALGIFYPLASMAAGDAAAALPDIGERWGALGYRGARAVSAPRDPIRAVGRSGRYRHGHRRILNVDASAVVCGGGPPSGAHSDILHPELTWLVLAAGGLV